jgi:molybdopterin-guanine dinucleotide biosynthesis protein A
MAGAIILAGGENTRIGQDKALLEFGGQPLLKIITDRLAGFFENLYVVTPEPEQYYFLERVSFVRDLFPDNKNITEAIYSGLSASREADNFVCACDMPYLNIKLVEYLFKLKGGFDAVVPVIEGKPAALHTVYSKNCLPVMEKIMAKGIKKVSRIFRDLNIKYVPENALVTEDPALKSFFHIKTYIDYLLVQNDF